MSDPRLRDFADTRPFRPLGPENHHLWLAQRMAKATGVDLAQAIADGSITQADWAEMVHECRSCCWAKGCARWLDRSGDALRDLPQGCVNRRQFAVIRDTQNEEVI